MDLKSIQNIYFYSRDVYNKKAPDKVTGRIFTLFQIKSTDVSDTYAIPGTAVKFHLSDNGSVFSTTIDTDNNFNKTKCIQVVSLPTLTRHMLREYIEYYGRLYIV